MNRLSPLLLLGCFLRTYLVGAAYNPRGLQNIGFLHAIEPALAALYGEGRALRAARMRYARHFNCHPFWIPMLLGIFLHAEAAIAEGRMNEALLYSLKNTTANTLSAIGDSFFGGSLLPAWGLGTSCLILAGNVQAAVLLTLALFLALHAFKLCSFILGLRRGLAVLRLLRRLDLINQGDRIKWANAVLLALFLFLALPGTSAPVWGAAALYLAAAGWLASKAHVPRVFIALLLLAFAVGLHLAGVFDSPL